MANYNFSLDQSGNIAKPNYQYSLDKNGNIIKTPTSSLSVYEPKQSGTVKVIEPPKAGTVSVVAPTDQQIKASYTSVAPKDEVNNFKSQANAIQKSIYRIGGDIYDASTNQKIPNEAILESQYSGAREVAAPTPFQLGTGIQGYDAALAIQKQAGLGSAGSKIDYTPPPTPPPTIPTGIQTIKSIGSIDTLQSQLAEIQKKIAERQTSLEQDKISLEAGKTALEGQGRAIPLGLVRGQQGKLETQAALDELTKMTELAGLQRQEAGLISQLQAQQQLAQPLTAGNEIIRYNPDTGQYETIYRGTATTSPMKISAGETIIDPTTGQIIYQAPAESADTLENQKKILEIEKLQQEILNTTSGVDRDIKQAQLAKLIKELEGAPEISPYQAERATRTIESVDELLNKAMQTPEIFGASAAAPIPDYLRSDAFRNYRSELDTLKANIAFSELTAMREASKTGGALGQVSDREGQLLQSALGALSMDQSPENVILQLQKIKDSINRWKQAIEAYGETGASGEYSW